MSTNAGEPFDLAAIRASFDAAHGEDLYEWALDHGSALLTEVARLRAGVEELADDARGIRVSEPHEWVEDHLRALLAKGGMA
jgi:4-aminobutyrate aminotransferase-like enzyme